MKARELSSLAFSCLKQDTEKGKPGIVDQTIPGYPIGKRKEKMKK